MDNIIGVVWSGGADSTCVLTRQAMLSSASNPVRAYTLIVSHNVISAQTQQAKARVRYLKWAKKQGFHIQHTEVNLSSESGMDSRIGQYGLWLTGLFPWLLHCTEVNFGYIQGDSFYKTHKTTVISERFLFAWDALCRLTESTIRLKYPLWDVTKEEVLSRLSSMGVPDNCWWTCDNPKLKTKPCGECLKCVALKEARILNQEKKSK